MTMPTKKTHLFSRTDVRREEFIDKLRERWIAERAAINLYDLALGRLSGERSLASMTEALPRFRDQEQLHADMIQQLLAELGRGDPRHEPATPSVNIAASEMASLIELMRGPELTTRHVLEVLLMAERFDRAGWELLTDLAKEAKLDEEWLRGFRAAGREEAEHEHHFRAHYDRMEREELFGSTAAAEV
jgi:rubrerythrin